MISLRILCAAPLVRLALAMACGTASLGTAHGQTLWPRPVVLPLAGSVAGVAEPAIPLNGSWKFTLTPPAEFWLNRVDPAGWTEVAVPGEPWMQGLKIAKDVEYPYKRDLAIPADYAGQRIFLRFDGVYSEGRVWIDGRLAGEHAGGFTRWQLDITPFVTAGQTHRLTVSIRDRSDDLSFASGYAGRYLGAEVAFEGEASTASLRFRLKDPAGAAVALSPDTATLSATAPAAEVAIPVSAPKLWDSEHPWLYTLEADLVVDGVVVETMSKRIGFREVQMAGNRMLVNGREVKLRGGCRHSVHPLAGRADVEAMAEIDVRRYKEANVNYIRTSHYPTTERFVELCDQYGIFLEEEMAIVWLDHGASNALLAGQSSSPAARPYFMRQISETLERDLSHPSIVIWSIGNENAQWGSNFQDERDYARAEDPTRVLKTGHNHYAPGWDTDAYLDLDAYHYPTWNSNFNKTGKPYLFDEYCHVMTYYGPGSIAEIDPNIRNFWGESLKTFWEAMYPAAGTLGGAIWGTIDDIFYTPDAAIGYGSWGIIDGWRREKPEWWLTKKGYSPVRIDNTALGNPGAGNPLKVPVKNWFDSTNFSELEFAWEVNGESGTLAADLAPRAAGQLTIPARNWQDQDEIRLTVTANQPGGYRYQVDEFLLRLKDPVIAFAGPQGPAPAVSETAAEITVSGSGFEIVFDKAAGQIRRGSWQGEVMLTGGPQLNLTPANLPAFTPTAVAVQIVANQAVVSIEGAYGAIGVSYVIRIDGTGRIETTYTLKSSPTGVGYSEVGVAFRVTDRCDLLVWDRKGLYSAYPPDHIGRNRGRAIKVRPGPALAYRQEPAWPWAFDMEDFHQYGPGHPGYGLTTDFRSSKEFIRSATVLNSATGLGLRAESDGASHAVRMGYPRGLQGVVDDRDSRIAYQGAWSDYADPGDYNGTERYSKQAGAYAEFAFSGTAVRFIGARNNNLGKMDVLLDGVGVGTIDAYAAAKQYQQVLFERSDLAAGNHTLRVVVRGDRNPAAIDSYALIDGFSAEAGQTAAAGGLWMHINRQWAYDLGWGNYERSSTAAAGFSDTVRLRLVVDPLPPEAMSLQLAPPDGSGRMQLAWSSQPGSFYAIEFSEDLALWVQIAGFLPAQGQLTRYTDDVTGRLGRYPAKGYYRIRSYGP